MEAIKCPNCGSEKVQELTEEKYVCLACDNVFLVHNLSKEFRQTDEHISDVHRDLAAKLDNLSGNMTSGMDDARLKTILFEAEENLANKNYTDAYAGFKKYVSLVPDSYIGYGGMYRTVSCANVVKNENDFYNGFDALKKALECNDCDKEALLKPILKEYQASSDKIFYSEITEEVHRAYTNANLPQVDLEHDIQQLIEVHEDKKQKKEDEKKKNEELYERAKINSHQEIQNYNSLSKKERKERLIKALLPPIILFLLSIFVFHGFFKVMLIVVSIIWAFIAWAEKGKPSEIDDNDPFIVNQRKQIDEEIDKEQQQADYWKNKLEILNSRTDLQIQDMEKIVFDAYNNNKGKKADELIRKLKIREEDEKEGFFKVYSYVPYSDTKNLVFKAKDDFCKNIRDEGDCVHDDSNTTDMISVKKLRKSQAYELQKLLFDAGLVDVEVNKM